MIRKTFYKLATILNPPKKKKQKQKIRKVYFGIRIRFLSLLFIVMFFIISFFTLLLYLNQRKILYEKKIDAAKIIEILSPDVRAYLNRDVKTTKEELKEKFQIIEDKAESFLSFNDFIYKIMLIDKKYLIYFSTDKYDFNKTYKFSYFLKCLKEKNEKIGLYKFNIKTNKKKYRYLAVTYPLVIQDKDKIELINDFNAYYKGDDVIKAKNSKKLWVKYKNSLSVDFYNEENKTLKNQDIDFLFLDLFLNKDKNKNWNIKKGESWLLNDKWLIDLKIKRKDFYKNDKNNNKKNNKGKINHVKNVDKLINKNMNRLFTLFSQIEESKRLGALAVLYDYDKITYDLNKDIKYPVYAALAFLILSMIIFLFVINVIIKNLKILEKWAIKVSEGDINTEIEIDTNDEIGRLSDVFNNMLYDIKMKFHLEKFVSRSTKKMIGEESSGDSGIRTGATGRKELAFIFTDVRGFTSFTEKNDAELVIKVLNMYFELQAEIIKAKKGDIDDYVGDQIMAHFGGEKKADTVLSVAIKIMREVKKLNEKREKNNLPYFKIGIGVHEGDVIVGNIGASEFRMDFACLGDAVNLTSRLCSNAEPDEILVSKKLYNKSGKKYKIKKHEPINVKGKANKIDVVSLLY